MEANTMKCTHLLGSQPGEPKLDSNSSEQRGIAGNGGHNVNGDRLILGIYIQIYFGGSQK